LVEEGGFDGKGGWEMKREEEGRKEKSCHVVANLGGWTKPLLLFLGLGLFTWRYGMIFLYKKTTCGNKCMY
jgi:hypothetical protein